MEQTVPMPESSETQPDRKPEHVSIPTPPVSLPPKMFDLVKAGWHFATTRFDLVGWYIVAVSAITLVSSELVAERSGIIIFFAVIASFVLSIYIAINSWTIIHAVSQLDISKTSFKQSFGWAAGNFFPLLWTSILSGLAIIIGTFLLIIPGIALSVYLYFSIYAQVHGAKAGVQALKQSFKVVQGRWWKTWWQLLVLSFYIFILFAIGGVIHSLLSSFAAEGSLAVLLLDTLLMGVFGAILSVISTYAIGQYFKWLRKTATNS